MVRGTRAKAKAIQTSLRLTQPSSATDQLPELEETDTY